MRPVTTAQWQDAVNAAEILLLIETGRLFGLIASGNEIDVQACLGIIEDGRKQEGVTPQIQSMQLELAELRESRNQRAA